MRPLYDEFEEFDFADSPALNRFMREQRREERRLASRKNDWRRTEDFFELDEFDDVSDYTDYQEEEFDRFAGIGTDN
jgi:hypothetical protein